MVLNEVTELGAQDGPAPVAMQGRALYITHGAFSHSNEKLLSALKGVLPDVSFEEFDVSAKMKGNYPALMRSMMGVKREYGMLSWQSKDKLRYRLHRSAAYNAEARALIASYVGNKTYNFTIQTQSLFNASIKGTPNFVYTDHVARAGHQARPNGLGAPSADWFDCEQSIYEDAEHVFTFGPSVRRLLKEDYGIPERKSSAIGGGASVVPTRPVDTSLERYRRRNILFVGVDWERKGGPELLAAFQALRQRMPDATLTIVGCKPDVPSIDGVEIVGRKDLSEIEDYFHAASCFCMPSRLEPFGVVFVEAMQFGLPVLSTDVSDIGAIVRHGETGMILPQGDVAALSDALFETLNKAEKCREIGLNGIERGKRFTWQAVARRMAAHLPITVGTDIPLLEAAW